MLNGYKGMSVYYGRRVLDWRCIDCTKAIGALFGNGRVCAFTKQHYCEDCHGGDELAVIPARLLFNWDGKPYPVAKSSLRFIQVRIKFLGVKWQSPHGHGGWLCAR